MTNQDIVSIITPVFNGERYVGRCIESVLRQSHPLEHIIVDDCSTDRSWEIITEYATKYDWIRAIRLEKNSGPSVARNTAIGQASGRYLAFLDIDDFWLPEKLSTQMAFMKKTGCALSFTDYRFVTEDGKHVGRRLQGPAKVNWNLHHLTRFLGCLTIILDRSQYPDFKFPDIPPEYRAEDFLAWSKCIEKTGPALRCPHDLARYAVVPQSRSSNAKKAARTVWNLYREVENIDFLRASVLFSIYALGVAWKRFRLQPNMQRDSIDTNYEWSVIN